MDWTQFIIFIITIIGFLILSTKDARANRQESREDWKRMDAKHDAAINAIHAEMKDFHQEIKNFHGRLCAIEERRLAMGK